MPSFAAAPIGLQLGLSCLKCCIVNQKRHPVRYDDIPELVFSDIGSVCKYCAQQIYAELVPFDRSLPSFIQSVADFLHRDALRIFTEYAAHNWGRIVINFVFMLRLASVTKDFNSIRSRERRSVFQRSK